MFALRGRAPSYTLGHKRVIYHVLSDVGAQEGVFFQTCGHVGGGGVGILYRLITVFLDLIHSS